MGIKINPADYIGYLEHLTPESLWVFDANVGKGGHTLFETLIPLTRQWRCAGLPWCVTFVHAVVGRPDLLGVAHPGSITLARRMKRKGFWRDTKYLPVKGDIIFCLTPHGNKMRIGHCGIVECIDGETVTSIDGNTVDPSGFFKPEQGGAVARRIRRLDSPIIAGYAAIGNLY